MLKDHADAELASRGRIGDRHRAAFPFDASGIGLNDPVHDFHQRALAGAVLTEQRMNLAFADLKVDPVVREHGGVALGDAMQGETRRTQAHRHELTFPCPHCWQLP